MLGTLRNQEPDLGKSTTGRNPKSPKLRRKNRN